MHFFWHFSLTARVHGPKACKTVRACTHAPTHACLRPPTHPHTHTRTRRTRTHARTHARTRTQAGGVWHQRFIASRLVGFISDRAHFSYFTLFLYLPLTSSSCFTLSGIVCVFGAGGGGERRGAAHTHTHICCIFNAYLCTQIETVYSHQDTHTQTHT